MGKERGCASREVYRRFEEDVRGGKELKCRGYKQMVILSCVKLVMTNLFWGSFRFRLGQKKRGYMQIPQQPNPTGHREREGNYPSH